MAGISVPQYEIFKIGTNKLKYSNWNLQITKEEAFKYQELISLFEAQEFRIMANKILEKPIWSIDFSKIFMQVVVDKKSDFARATGKKGVTINGVNYKRFVGTTGGLKNNTLLFCNSQYIDKLNELCECKRNPDTKLVPAKYEAYKALTCSASQPICDPHGILVVKDCITQYFADVISLDDGGDSKEPTREIIKNKPLENNVSDGFNLCTIQYMQRVAESLGLDYIPGGVCLRNAWLKGMLYPFPIYEFIEKYNNGNYMIEDIWGNMQDIRQCEMIVTESSLKLWGAYDNIEQYVNAYKECGYGFSVTKISPHVLEEQRELNYQYLQSYEFTDEDVEELCAPTINYLKDAMCGDYSSTVKFLGINENTDVNSWQRALYTSEYMLGDPYIIDSVHRYIKKKMNDAKIGKLFVNGNYQIASGDPFALMQSLCGLEVTGLLKGSDLVAHVTRVKYFTKDKEKFINPDNLKKYKKYLQSNIIKNQDVKDTTYKRYEGLFRHFLMWLGENYGDLDLYSDEFMENAVDIMENYIMFCQETLLNHKKIINMKISAVSSFYIWSMKRGFVKYHPFDGKLDRMKKANEEHILNSYFLTEEQVQTIRRELSENDKYSIQDQILFEVSFDSANRIGALLRLQLSKLDLENNMFVDIREKEGYRTQVVFGDVAKELIQEWLEMRKNDYDHLECDSLLITKYNGEYKPMGDSAIRDRMKKYGEIIGISDYRPHCQRKTRLNLVYEETGDLALAAELANHRSTETTREFYCRKQTKAEVMNKINALRSKNSNVADEENK